jgi:hypothetical protein
MVGADPGPRMGSSGSRRVAWIAFGVYLLSLLPGGFLCFYFGFMCFLNPLIHTFPRKPLSKLEVERMMELYDELP